MFIRMIKNIKQIGCIILLLFCFVLSTLDVACRIPCVQAFREAMKKVGLPVAGGIRS